ncbi:MAG TPA: hypothetical protein VFP49_12255 [Nitrososphaeraceae archaeon]|nr:hypothetical protein [Nitrososphaeraceae archaeon]
MLLLFPLSSRVVYPDRRIEPIGYTMVSSGIRYDNDETIIKQYDEQIKKLTKKKSYNKEELKTTI